MVATTKVTIDGQTSYLWDDIDHRYELVGDAVGEELNGGSPL